MASIGPRRLVVGERQIQPDVRVDRIGLERRLVLLDGVVVLAEADVGGAEIRQGVGAIGVDGQRGLVGVDGAQQVAGLLQLERAREQAVEVLRRLSSAPDSPQPQGRTAGRRSRTGPCVLPRLQC